METVTVTARSPRDLCEIAPMVLGFYPEASVVMMTFGAEHPFHARIDIGGGREEWGYVAETLVEPASRHQVTRVVLLCYTDDGVQARGQFKTLTTVFERAGIRIVDGIQVLPSAQAERGQWRSLTKAGARGVYDCSTSANTVAGVVAGVVTERDRAALLAQVRPSGPVVSAVEVAPNEPQDLAAEKVALLGLVVDCTSGQSPAFLDDRELAIVLADVEVPDLRAMVWAAMDQERARVWAEFWLDVTRRAPEGYRLSPATLAGWGAWLCGSGALAWVCREEAEAAGDCALAELLAVVLEGAVPPATWVEFRATLHGGVG